MVTCVKLSIGSHPPLEDSSQLRMELCKWNFKTLEDHIISLQSLTSRLERWDKKERLEFMVLNSILFNNIKFFGNQIWVTFLAS